jgi:TetR/AcrR family tetracycline transcriptional repressor
VAIVPYRDSRRRRPRPQLDRAQVIRAALKLLDEVGLDALTMRRLAERLGVKAASLYRHVRDKQELLVLLADAVTGEIPVVRDGSGWQKQLVDVAWRVRRGMLLHRDGARLLASTAPVGQQRLRHIENVMSLLLSAGLRAREAARVGYHLNNFVTEFVADEARMVSAAEASGTTRSKLMADARRYFRTLPSEEFPTLVKLADEVTEDDSDGLFQFGVDVWVHAIERLLKRRK